VELVASPKEDDVRAFGGRAALSTKGKIRERKRDGADLNYYCLTGFSWL